MANTKKRRPRARPTLTGLLCLVVPVPWLLCMGLLTAVFAQRQAETTLTQYGSQAYEALAETTLPWGGVSGGRTLDMQLTSALFDHQGNYLGGSWETFLSFEYLTQEEYEAGVKTSGRYARATLDPDHLTDNIAFFLEGDTEFQLTHALRLEGVLEGSQFTPVTVQQFYLPPVGPDWGDMYQNPDALAPGTQTVTLYATNFHLCTALENSPLTYAQAAEEHRRTFTSHMAHELKTPLAVIHSYAQGLQEHIAEDKREKYLATICSEAERMNGMVLELLNLSRLEAGRVKLRRETFSLSQLTRSTLEKLAPSLEAKGLRLSTALEDPAPVLADRGRMAQVVENLLTNAVKYTPAGGEIGVEVTQTGQHTTLRLSNDCPPISQEELEQLFEPFYRREDAAPGEGTGLGLAIVRHIVQLHGGSCTAQATPSGVQFTVTL